jgi:CRISPR/Cas system-associated endonuclease Cas1
MEQGMTLTVDGDLFSIERTSKVVHQVRMADVDEVLVFGGIALSPPAIGALLARGIDTVFLTAHGRYRGRLVGRPHRNVELRLTQFERLRDTRPVRFLAEPRGTPPSPISTPLEVASCRVARNHRR